jgi:molybdopterin converting factor small subunit
MANVTVRAFAALREDFGPPRSVEAATVAELVTLLCEAHGERFAARLARSQVAVGSERVPLDDTTPLADGVEVVLLPPFSGG